MTKAHDHDPHPLSTTGICTCGLSASHRSHQPLWWRLLNRGEWR